MILRSKGKQWLVRVRLDDGEERYYPNKSARRRWGPYTRVRFVAEHYQSHEQATESGERLLRTPNSRVTAYEVERRDQPPDSGQRDEQESAEPAGPDQDARQE